MAKICLVAAMDQNRVIGYRNQLPWHMPADLRHFKSVTIGKPVLMGRRTFEAIGRPLPKRRNLIVTHNPGYQAQGGEVFHDLAAALAEVKAQAEVMVIGGGEIFAQCLSIAQTMYLTFIQHAFKGDAFFPAWNSSEWQEVSREEHSADADNPYPYSFVQLERVSA